ncbi:MAG TPA: hypothetical protein VGV14_15420, partial [Rhodanobacter sp.]|nr:hypothetical protein [Rhodanobacter sp.]
YRLPNTYLQTCRKALRPVMQAANGNTIPLLTSDMYRDFPTNPGLLHDFTVGNNGGVDRVATYGFHAYPVSFGAKTVVRKPQPMWALAWICKGSANCAHDHPSPYRCTSAIAANEAGCFSHPAQHRREAAHVDAWREADRIDPGTGRSTWKLHGSDGRIP